MALYKGGRDLFYGKIKKIIEVDEIFGGVACIMLYELAHRLPCSPAS